jgi:hypothetical protein
VRWAWLIVLGFAPGCVTLTPQGQRVAVYRERLDGPPADRTMPAACRLLSSNPPQPLTELDLEGQKDPFRAERNRTGAAGANALLVLSTMTMPRRSSECPASSPITDCPPSFGAWFRVALESYTCPDEALRQLDRAIPSSATRAPGALPGGIHLRIGEP